MLEITTYCKIHFFNNDVTWSCLSARFDKLSETTSGGKGTFDFRELTEGKKSIIWPPRLQKKSFKLLWRVVSRLRVNTNFLENSFWHTSHSISTYHLSLTGSLFDVFKNNSLTARELFFQFQSTWNIDKFQPLGRLFHYEIDSRNNCPSTKQRVYATSVTLIRFS